jgi:hypothetical protein
MKLLYFFIFILLTCNPIIQAKEKVFNYSYPIQTPEIASQRFDFNINGVTAAIPYESNYDLHQKNRNVTRLIVAIHSSNHDAKMYYRNTLLLAQKLNKTNETLIVAPHLLIGSLVSKEKPVDFLFWEVPPFRGSSRAFYKGEKANVSAYEILDTLIDAISQSHFFPNLQEIVIFGHSAGGQLVNRYAAYSRFNKNSLHVRYVVMAPSSYLYFNNERALAGNTNRFDTPTLPSKVYNRWGYGMEKLYGVHKRHHVTAERMHRQYQNSEIIYLVGANDNNPNDASLGKSQGAMLQGHHRLERAQIYYNYLQHIFTTSITKTQHLHVIPNAAHSSKALMSSAKGSEALFF